MPFSKTFPKNVPGSNYPIWQEVFLTEDEEKEVEEKCQREHYIIMDTCLKDARSLSIKNAANTEDNIARIAIALFEKRASHIVFWKESKAKEKFDAKL